MPSWLLAYGLLWSQASRLAHNTIKKQLTWRRVSQVLNAGQLFSKLYRYAEMLTTWLAIEATKSRKQRRTLGVGHTFAQEGESQELTLRHRTASL
jgi:hypothetical protein